MLGAGGAVFEALAFDIAVPDLAVLALEAEADEALRVVDDFDDFSFAFDFGGDLERELLGFL